jgi:pyruvate kinase
MRRTKLVCTIGPACDSDEMLERMFLAGTNVARINFSHGTAEHHRDLIRRIKVIRKRLGLPIAILQDLQGPKVRIGRIENDNVWLERGATFTLTSDPIVGDSLRVGVSLRTLAQEVRVGHRVLLADGMIELLVEKIEAPDVHCRVVVGGTLSSHKGVNLPSAHVEVESLSEKDLHDTNVGLEEGVDTIALSFVRSERDVEALRDVIRAAGKDTRIIAKIEKPQAVENIDSILDASDGVMIARGDLGVEIDLARVPLIQKSIIRKANAIGKPVITATQMLVRMVDNPRPTRAEAADVANAILDGTDAVMLSEETAAGQFPLEAVAMMHRIAVEVEDAMDESKFRWDFHEKPSMHDAITRSSYNIARGVGATGIITPTWSGSTARLVARFRPRQPIIATTPNATTANFLAFCWGVVPLEIAIAETMDDQLALSIEAAANAGLVGHGELVVITGGTPLQIPGTSNFIKVERVKTAGGDRSTLKSG